MTDPPYKLAQLLESSRLETGLTSETLARIAPKLSVEEHPSGALIRRAGDPATEVLFVAKRRVKVTVPTEGAKEALLNYCGEGDSLGQLALMGGGPFPVNIQAVEDVVLLTLDQESFRKVFQEAPDFAAGLLRKSGVL